MVERKHPYYKTKKEAQAKLEGLIKEANEGGILAGYTERDGTIINVSRHLIEAVGFESIVRCNYQNFIAENPERLEEIKNELRCPAVHIIEYLRIKTRDGRNFAASLETTPFFVKLMRTHYKPAHTFTYFELDKIDS